MKLNRKAEALKTYRLFLSSISALFTSALMPLLAYQSFAAESEEYRDEEVSTGENVATITGLYGTLPQPLNVKKNSKDILAIRVIRICQPNLALTSMFQCRSRRSTGWTNLRS